MWLTDSLWLLTLVASYIFCVHFVVVRRHLLNDPRKHVMSICISREKVLIKPRHRFDIRVNSNGIPECFHKSTFACCLLLNKNVPFLFVYPWDGVCRFHERSWSGKSLQSHTGDELAIVQCFQLPLCSLWTVLFALISQSLQNFRVCYLPRAELPDIV